MLVKVLVVDDHAIFREGVKSVLRQEPDVQIVGEADDGSVAITQAAELKPDVILMDIQMPFDGLHAAVEIHKTLPDIRIVMLTISERDADLYAAIRAGARGYLLKGAGVAELIACIKSAAAGGAIFTPAMAAKMLDDFEAGDPKNADNTRLTARETEILGLVAGGASNKEIAARLFISEPTVKTHLRNILDKLHLKNRSQAAVYAAQQDWLRNPRSK